MTENWGPQPLWDFEDGCAIAMEEDESDDSWDDGSVALLPAGVIMNDVSRYYRDWIKVTDYWECDMDEGEGGDYWDWYYGLPDDLNDPANVLTLPDEQGGTACHARSAKLKTPASYICSPNNRWLLCDEVHEGYALWGEGHFNYLYKCKLKEGEEDKYEWRAVDSDDDRDGYVRNNIRTNNDDCQDNPENDPPGSGCEEIYEEIEDAKLDEGKTVEEIREAVKNFCKENNPKYSRCAVCINPGAPEVCGDRLNNDCGQGEIEYVEVIDVELDPETPDDCHQNRAACTQEEESIPGGKITRTCELVGDSGGESSGDSCSDDSDCTEDGEKCVTDNDDAVITGYNIFNERFSWIDDREGGYCCGYGGVGDLGIVKTGATTEGSQVPKKILSV